MSEAELAKLKKRQARNMAKAGAEGFLMGLASQLTPEDTVVDCGANVGDVAEPLAETGAALHAFEPDPFAFGKLAKRLRGRPNVTLHNQAVGVRAGRVRLMRAAGFDDNPKGHSVKSTVVEGGRRIDEAEGIEVDQIDLPAFLRGLLADGREIALLKMDIEGAELDILEAMEADGLFAPIRCTLVETHERKFKALRPRFHALKDRVAAAYPKRKVNLDWI